MRLILLNRISYSILCKPLLYPSWIHKPFEFPNITDLFTTQKEWEPRGYSLIICYSSPLLYLPDQPPTGCAKQDVLRLSWLVIRQQDSPGELLWVQVHLPPSSFAIRPSGHVKQPVPPFYWHRHCEIWGCHADTSTLRRAGFEQDSKINKRRWGINLSDFHNVYRIKSSFLQGDSEFTFLHIDGSDVAVYWAPGRAPDISIPEFWSICSGCQVVIKLRVSEVPKV